MDNKNKKAPKKESLDKNISKNKNIKKYILNSNI